LTYSHEFHGGRAWVWGIAPAIENRSVLDSYPGLSPIRSSLNDKTRISGCLTLWEGKSEGKTMSRRIRRSKVLGSWSQARTTWPAQTSRPSLYFPTWNGAPISSICDSTARLRVLSPATLLCLPQPVKMLFPPPTAQYHKAVVQSLVMHLTSSGC
jgi:hypothetical protein